MSENKDKKMKMGLFKVRHRWQDEWQDMPEFIQEDASTYQTVLIHLLDEEAVNKFSKLIGQKITKKTKYLYFPEVEKFSLKHVRYVDTKKEEKDES